MKLEQKSLMCTHTTNTFMYTNHYCKHCICKTCTVTNPMQGYYSHGWHRPRNHICGHRDVRFVALHYVHAQWIVSSSQAGAVKVLALILFVHRCVNCVRAKRRFFWQFLAVIFLHKHLPHKHHKTFMFRLWATSLVSVPNSIGLALQVKLGENEHISHTALWASQRDWQAYELFMAISVFWTTGTEREPYIYNLNLLKLLRISCVEAGVVMLRFEQPFPTSN